MDPSCSQILRFQSPAMICRLQSIGFLVGSLGADPVAMGAEALRSPGPERLVLAEESWSDNRPAGV